MSFLKSVVLATGLFLSLTTFADGDHYSPIQPQPGPYQPQPPPPPGDWNTPGISLRYLGFWYTGPGCFFVGQPSIIPSHIVPVMQQGAIMVETTQGYRLMVPYDPIFLTRFPYRNQIDDMIASAPNGVGLYPRRAYLPQGYVEVFQRPMEAGLCNYGI